MKSIRLFISLAIAHFPLFIKAQGAAVEVPFKGAKKIIATYNISGDSLYTVISKALLKDGYVIASRDKELKTILTQSRHLKFIDYKAYLIVSDSSIIFTGSCNDGIGISIGFVYSEPQWIDVEYRGKSDSRRKAFDDIVRFAESSRPINIGYSK